MTRTTGTRTAGPCTDHHHIAPRSGPHGGRHTDLRTNLRAGTAALGLAILAAGFWPGAGAQAQDLGQQDLGQQDLGQQDLGLTAEALKNAATAVDPGTAPQDSTAAGDTAIATAPVTPQARGDGIAPQARGDRANEQDDDAISREIARSTAPPRQITRTAPRSGARSVRAAPAPQAVETRVVIVATPWMTGVYR